MSPGSARSHRTRLLGAVLALGAALGAPVSALDPASVAARPSPAEAETPAALVRPAAVGAAIPAASAARSEGLRLESRTTYTLDPVATAVHVVYEATITNELAPVSGYFGTSYSYLPDFGVPMVKEAVNVSATKADGSPLPTTVEDLGSPVIAGAVVDLVPDLFYQDTQSIRLVYDIPRVAARTAGISRVNEAFATFPVFAIGDPGLASVEVVVPDHFDVELIGSELDKSSRDDNTVFAAAAIEDPETFDVSVVARHDDALIARDVELGEHDATVLGWPGDDEWVDFVATHLEEGIPAMADLLGLEWPAERDMKVVETVSPYLYGYAGWYQPHTALMEIGDELDPQVVLHELSHAWFNDDLYDSRWINEALANVYAHRTQVALGHETPPGPIPTNPTDPGALRLNDWSNPALQADLSFEQEDYGYQTSFGLLQRIADEIGIERLSEVVRVTDADLLPYGAPGLRSRHPGTHTWRQFLDVLTDVGGSTAAEPLFRDLVVAPEDLPELDARAAARTAYHQLVADTGDWLPPLPVREAMSRWDFGVATRHLEAVRALLPRRKAVLAGLADLGIAAPDRLREMWERNRTLDDLEHDLDGALAALDAYRAADEHRRDTDGPLAAVGLALSDVDGRLDDARAQLAAGRFAAAASSVADVEDLLDQATTAAIARTLALAAIAGVGVALRRTKLRPPRDWVSRLGPHTIADR